MPTRAEYVRYLRSLEGGYGPARGLRNNDNQFNTWYYGRRVSGDDYAWCLVTECYAQNHFDILAANGGKAVGCPSMKARAERVGAKVVVRPRSTKDMQPGDPLAYDFNDTDSPEHTGTFVEAISSTEFYAVEGNTSTSQYSDAIALKRRSVHDVLWHIELMGVDGNDTTEDDMPDYVSLGLSKPQPVKNGQAARISFDTEYSDKTKQHADGPHPGILSGGRNGRMFSIEVDFSGSGGGDYRLIETDPAKGYAVTKTYPVNKPTYVGLCDPNQHLYVEVHPAADGDVNVAVKALSWAR